MELFSLISGSIVSFIVYFFGSHPHNQKSLKHKIPPVEFGRIKLLPNFKIIAFRYEIHLHHWLNHLIVFTFLYFYTGNMFGSYLFVKGLAIGGIIQGFTYSDRFRILKKV